MRHFTICHRTPRKIFVYSEVPCKTLDPLLSNMKEESAQKQRLEIKDALVTEICKAKQICG